jgi:hypothetical protein
MTATFSELGCLRRLVTWVGVGMIVLGAAGSTRADLMTFFGQDLNRDEDNRLDNHPQSDAARAAFLAHLQGVPATATFDSPPRLTTAASGNLKLLFAAPGRRTVTAIVEASPGSDPFDVFVFGPPFDSGLPPGFPPSPFETYAGRFSIGPADNYIEAAAAFTLRFSAPQGAFGFYATDVGDVSGQLILTLSDGATSRNVAVPHLIARRAAGSVLYFGVIDTAHPFTSISFGNSSFSFDDYGFDNFTVDLLPVAEPTGMILFGLGVIGILAHQWRHRIPQTAHPHGRHARPDRALGTDSGGR